MNSNELSREKFVRNLDWNLLRMFVTLVDAGSLTLAAEELGLRQPSVSAALKRLEISFGKKLIERGPGQFQLTSAGEELYKEAIEIRAAVYRLGISMNEVTETVTGHVVITMPSHVICPFFNDVLGEFHAKHPKATLEIRVNSSPKIMESVTSRTASFGICLANYMNPKLSYKHMFREYFGLFCGQSHPLFNQKGLNTPDLRGNDWVSFETDQLTDVLQPLTLLRANAGPEDMVIGSSANLEEVRRMIFSGLGIGPLPLHVAKRDVDGGKLFRLPPYEHPPEINIYLISNPATKLNPAEAEMFKMLQEKIDSIPLEQRTFDDAHGDLR